MNITSGTGVMSYTPQLLSVEAYSALPLGSPAENLPDGPRSVNVLAGQFTYGGLGTCQKASIVLAGALPAWATWGRLLRFKLQDAGGTGYVFAAIIQSINNSNPNRAQIDLLAPFDLYGGSLATNARPLVSATRRYGTSAPVALAGETLAAQYTRELAAYPQGDRGIGPDLALVSGLPASASRVMYAADGRATQITRKLAAIPPYVTDVYWDPGNGFSPYTASRSGVPDFVPRVLGSASANPATLTTTNTVYFSVFSGQAGSAGSVSGSSSPVTISISGTDPASAPALTYQTSDHAGPASGVSKVTVVIGFNVTGLSAASGTSNWPRLRYTASYWRGGTIQRASVYVGNLTLNNTGQGQLSFDFTSDMLANGGQFRGLVEVYPNGGSVNITFTDPATPYTSSTPNYGGIIYPAGWIMPFVGTDTYQFRLPGWHVPPIGVTGLPGGVAQDVSGAEVTWQKDNASTLILTGARPYPGQKAS